MKKERILPFAMSQKLDEKELQEISAASGSTQGTAEATYNHTSGADAKADVVIDG